MGVSPRGAAGLALPLRTFLGCSGWSLLAGSGIGTGGMLGARMGEDTWAGGHAGWQRDDGWEQSE